MNHVLNQNNKVLEGTKTTLRSLCKGEVFSLLQVLQKPPNIPVMLSHAVESTTNNSAGQDITLKLIGC